jgi:hypothetical protein
MSNEELQESTTSVKYGFCKAMSEFGFSPQETEDVLKKVAAPGALAALSVGKNVIGPALGIGVGLGALAGVGTAALRGKVDRMAEGTESKEMRESRMKVEFYKKMISDLKNDI